MRQALGMTLKFYIIEAKKFNLEVKKFWKLIPTFVKVTWGKSVRGGRGLFGPRLIRLSLF